MIMKPCKLANEDNKYSNIRTGKSTMSRHRYEWIKVNGPIPNGLCICHRCDNKACYEIEHLFIGSYQDNVDDYIDKGLWDPIGEENPSAKLGIEDVNKIKEMYSTGRFTQKFLGWMFGVTQSCVSRIILEKSWANS
jgi:hypothetical protein